MILLLRTLIAYFVMNWGIRLGDFDPAIYRREVVENSDFRKYDDNLRMTLDCTPALADRIEERLTAARAAGIAQVRHASSAGGDHDLHRAVDLGKRSRALRRWRRGRLCAGGEKMKQGG